jgi:2-polyprenyl-3-methyl-5-hydroxy-6-metoxy-1,4-benzoquinol methylase
MSNKASKEYWDQCYTISKFKKAKQKDSIRLFIEKYIPTQTRSSAKTCIEIGCFPGTYLSILGDLGYQLSGIDFCDNLSTMEPVLMEMGYELGSFLQEDFLAFTPSKTYDVVASFGFIEHFTSYSELIEKHIEMVSPGGYLILEAPNFVGNFQKMFHEKFDKENLARHYLPAMDIGVWKKIAEENDFEVLFCGYFGHFNIILENDGQSSICRFFVKCIKKMKWLFDLIIPRGSESFSPYCGLIARKK